ncbi:MAG: DDE-type integrase/transposase/recombinase [Methylococcales bacterium]|nr:DDE-type integrase/transposase/recombinase [Methylococcales bacterium]
MQWTSVQPGRFYDWRKRYGKANEHNGKIPRDHWLEDWERQAILDYHDRNPLNGYRRLTFMMIDDDVVAVSPSTVYRVLRKAGRLDRWNRNPSTKGTGFVQPTGPHKHWHIDIAYLNLAGTFYYICTIIDGFSRFIVHWEIREQMKESDVELIIQLGLDKYPLVNPRIISDNGPQFVARAFKKFVRLAGMTHVRTSPYYPQSNGKIERWHRTLKETVRPQAPQNLTEAQKVVATFVEHYNHQRLHAALGWVTPNDKLHGRAQQIHDSRDQKLEAARDCRAQARQAARMSV